MVEKKLELQNEKTQIPVNQINHWQKNESKIVVCKKSKTKNWKKNLNKISKSDGKKSLWILRFIIKFCLGLNNEIFYFARKMSRKSERRERKVILKSTRPSRSLETNWKLSRWNVSKIPKEMMMKELGSKSRGSMKMF